MQTKKIRRVITLSFNSYKILKKFSDTHYFSLSGAVNALISKIDYASLDAEDLERDRKKTKVICLLLDEHLWDILRQKSKYLHKKTGQDYKMSRIIEALIWQSENIFD